MSAFDLVLSLPREVCSLLLHRGLPREVRSYFIWASSALRAPRPAPFAPCPIDRTNKINDVLRMNVQTDVEIGSMIARTVGIKGGTPHIAGTGVTVRTIVRYYKLGMSPGEIAAEYPQLDLAQVYAALAHYHANRDEMDADMAAEEAESDRIEREHQPQKRHGA